MVISKFANLGINSSTSKSKRSKQENSTWKKKTRLNETKTKLKVR